MTETIPSIPELCLAASVSERRLRKAFNDEFSVPPSQFFREWALTKAHHLLRQNVGNPNATVTKIATSVGFGHLGRFAGAYRDLYGERPSATLSAAG